MFRKIGWSSVVVLALLGAMTLGVTLLLPLDDGQRSATPSMSAVSSPSPSVSTSAVASPTPTVSALASAPVAASTPTLPAGCDVAKGLTQPVSLEIGTLGARQVVALPPEDGVSPVPPDFDPDIFAWDNQSGELGVDAYKALFTAHTYQARDTALGNQLQQQLSEGDVIRAVNSAESTLCYKVKSRLEVAVEHYGKAVDSYSGAGLLVITVCSGLKDGEWTMRTVWVAQLLGE